MLEQSSVETLPVRVEMVDFLPKEWAWSKPDDTVWCACYQVVLVPDEILSRQQMELKLDVRDARVLFLLAELTHQAPVDLDFKSNNGQLHVQAALGGERTTQKGAHMIFLAPIASSATEESRVRALEVEVVSLLRLRFGRSIAFKKIFEERRNFAREATTTSPPFPNPARDGIPDLTVEHLQELQVGIEKLSGSKRESIGLALRWLARGDEGSGADTFLSYWIAMESLLMPNTTDIAPIKSRLASIYPDLKSGNFLTGELYGLRCDIVHDGFISAMHGMVTDYMRAILSDVIEQELGITVRQKVRCMLKDQPGRQKILHAIQSARKPRSPRSS